MPDNYNVDDKWGAQALDYNISADETDYAVVSGCEVSIETGTLGENNDAISVNGGTAVFDGSEMTVSSRQLDVDVADDSFPRKDVVYVDEFGDPQVISGQPAPAEPAQEVGPQTERPAPPSFSDTAGVVLAEIWIGAGVETISTSEITDRRVGADATRGVFEVIDTLIDSAGVSHSGELADLDDIPDHSQFADNPHGNEDHSTNFAPDGHDNNAHSTNYAEVGHGNEDHSTNYASQTELNDRAKWRRTIEFDTGSGDDYMKIARISTPDGFKQGRFKATIYFATDNGNPSPRMAEVFGAVRKSSHDLQAIEYGEGQKDSQNVELIVTEKTNSNSENDYYLYAHAKDYNKSKIVVEYGDIWGSFDIVRGLTSSDIIGSEVANTSTPTATVNAGEFHALDTLVDPSGTKHTGELADKGDLVRVDDSGSAVVYDTLRMNFASGLSVSSSTSGEVTVDADGGSAVDGALIAPDGVSVQEWNTIDVADHGYDGTRSGDLTTLIENNPNSTFILRPGGEYEMSTYSPTGFDYFALISKGAPFPSIYPHESSDTQQEFFDFGGYGTRVGHVWLQNLDFHNLPDKTDSNGWRYDSGLISSCSANENGLVKNVKFTNPRHRIEDDGDGTVTEHGSRYQIHMEAAESGVTVEVDGLYMPDGGRQESANGEATGHAIGFSVEEHHGKLEIRNSYIRDFVDNGFYITFDNPTDDDKKGNIDIKKATARDCCNSNFRLGPNTRMENCKSVHKNTSSDTFEGIGLNLNKGGTSNVVVDGLRLIAKDHSNDIIRVSSNVSTAEISNIWYTGDSTGHVELNGTPPTNNRGVTFEDCTFDDRDNVTAKPCTVTCDRDDVTFRDCTFNANRSSIWVVGDRVNVENCRFHLPTDMWAIRLGDYGDSTPEPKGMCRFDGNTIAQGRAVQQKGSAETSMLQIKNNDFTDATAVVEDVGGELERYVARDNDGWVAGGPPGSASVFGRIDTEGSAYSRPPSGSSTAIGDQVYVTGIDEHVGNVGDHWQLLRNENYAGVFDNFEDGDLAEWSTVENGSTSTSRSMRGSTSMLIDGLNEVSGNNVSQQGDGLQYYPRVGDKFQFWVYPTDIMYTNLYGFGVQSTGDLSDSIKLNFDYDDGRFLLNDSPASSATIASDAMSWSADQWYQVVIDWRYRPGKDPEVDVEIRDIDGNVLGADTGVVNNPSRTTGGIGTYCSGDDRAFLDDWRILP